jgi:hypothetical protein
MKINKKAMNIKRIIASSFMMFVLVSALMAQQKPDKLDFEKFKSEKIAFITQAIQLTPQEAEKFWPVYNEYEQKKFALMKERRDLEEKLQEKRQTFTEKDYAAFSRQMAANMSKDGELIVKYNEEFLKILPAKKVVELYDAEVNFRRQLLRDFRHRDGEGEKKKP